MVKSFFVTFDTVTHESASHGGVDSMGFVHANGQLWESIGRLTESDRAAFRLSLREAVGLMGGVESQGGPSWYEADSRRDIRTGAETRFALHAPRGVTPSSVKRIERVLRAERLL